MKPPATVVMKTRSRFRSGTAAASWVPSALWLHGRRARDLHPDDARERRERDAVLSSPSSALLLTTRPAVGAALRSGGS